MTKKVYPKEEMEALFKQAVEGTLPEDFDGWNITNERDVTVAEVFISKHRYSPSGYKVLLEKRKEIT